jgi:hypothetical protein
LQLMLAVGTIVAKGRHSHSHSPQILLSFCSFHMILRQAINIRPDLRAIVKEYIRWMPTNIMVAPDAIMQDDKYIGLKIPAEATV